MPVYAEGLSIGTFRHSPSIVDFPTCQVCADTMIAPEASVFYSDDDVVSYLWTCETCGYGFVTRHQMANAGAFKQP